MKKIIELLQEAELALQHSLFTDLNKADIKESLTKLQTDIFERWQTQALDEKDDNPDDMDDSSDEDIDREKAEADRREEHFAPSEGFDR